MKKIRIMFELSTLGYGGTEKAIYTFIENLDKEKFNIYLFFSTDYKTFSYYRRKVQSYFLKKSKIRFIEKYTTYFARLNDFKSLLGKEKVIVGNASLFLKSIKYLKIDIIHFSRGVSDTHYTKNIEKIPKDIKLVESNIFGKNAEIKYTQRVDKFFFISDWLLKKSTWAPTDKAFLLYNPIKKPTSKTTLHEKYNIPLDAVVLGRMSRPSLDDGKFIYNVLKNVMYDSTYFITIGASATFKEQIKAHKNIIFIDPTTNVDIISSFYNTIDILLHYREEGETFGMNIAEAMIHGKPIVSHYSYMDNAQVELIIGDKNKISGNIVAENDIEAYTIAVNSLIKDKKLRTYFSSNAKQRAMNLFSEDIVTYSLETEYLEFYRSKELY